jgi:hypothetical protein
VLPPLLHITSGIIKEKPIILYFETKPLNNHQQRGVSHCGLVIYIKKVILRQKKKNYGNSNISLCKKYNLQKNLQKKPKSFMIL